MSTVFDATALTVGQGTVPLGPVVTVVDVVVPTATLVVNVPGVQGPPGLQNVYVQANDPAVEFGWGAEQEGFLWAQIVE